MTNPLKGEITLNIGGVEHKARLTIDTIMQIENAVGCGIIKLAQRMADGDVRVSDIMNVLTPALRGGGKNITPKDVSAIITNVGIIEATTAVATLLTSSISPPTDDSEENSEGKHQAEE